MGVRHRSLGDYERWRVEGHEAYFEGLTPAVGLMHAYALFFIGCGATGVPALVLFGLLFHRHSGPRRLRPV